MQIEYWTIIVLDNQYDHEDPHSTNIILKRNHEDAEYAYRDYVMRGGFAKVQMFHHTADTNNPQGVISRFVNAWASPLKKQVELNAKAKSTAPAVKKKISLQFGANPAQLYDEVMAFNEAPINAN